VPPIPRRAPATRLAVNLFDSERIDPLTRQILLGGRVNVDHAVLVESGGRQSSPGDAALEFTCDLLTAACMVHAMRNMDRKAGRAPTRAYKCQTTPDRWTKVPGDTDLIVISDNQCALNIEVFPPPPISQKDMDFTPEDVIFTDDD
jgi:hypothetical protein